MGESGSPPGEWGRGGCTCRQYILTLVSQVLWGESLRGTVYDDAMGALDRLGAVCCGRARRGSPDGWPRICPLGRVWRGPLFVIHLMGAPGPLGTVSGERCS